MKSRGYYEVLSDEQLIEEARFEAAERRPAPDLMAVLADRLDELLTEVYALEAELEDLKTTRFNA